MRKAHHVIWYMEYGYWPEYLLHTCDTPGCVNIFHLREGTHQDNMADMVYKGRQIKGQRHGRAKVSDAQAQEIFNLKGSGLLQRVIGERYGISASQVGRIQSGENRR